MSEFESEPYRIYADAHTRLNNYIKISTVAVEYLYNAKESKEDLSLLINELIADSKERWTPRIIKDPEKELNQLKNDLTKSAIIWVYSAFDVFFKQVEGMLSSNFSKEEKNTTIVSIDEENREHKLIELYAKLNWDKNELDDLLIILKFYESLRHCVAHNQGLPSGKLLEISESIEFKDAISNWKTKFKKKSISPPPVVNDKNIELKPHHSILYSETCLRIAKKINTNLFKLLGVNYFIEKTIKKHLLETSVLSKPVCSNYSRYLVYHLNHDFKIKINPYNDVYCFYEKEDELKQHKSRYYTLKNNR